MATQLPSYQNLYEGLETLQSPNATVPDTRMRDATQVRDMVVRAIRYDMQYRDWKRAKLKGLVDGNPPYKQAALVAAGRADECNVNWRQAKYFLDLARGMLYDVVSEAETLATIKLDPWHREAHGLDPSAFDDYSRVVTDEFDRLQKGDPRGDYTMQLSQGQMVLYGCGPQVFEDELDWRTEAFESRMLLVPEWARSTTNKWEWAALVVEYTPDRLYARIQNAAAATKRGWDVAATRKSIMNAHPLTRTGVLFQNWSWHQDLLKNGTYYYADQSKTIRAAHFYFREFPRDGEELGRITESIIDLDMQSSTSTDGAVNYLFRAPRRYADWNECIHPFYWSSDVNGYHHSVSGIGLEMFAALEYWNRLFCRTADDAFAPKLFFKPTTASEREKMAIAQVGRYAMLPANMEAVQQHIQPFLQDGIAMTREVQGVVTSNLSQYRSQSMTKQQGNPVTARQIDYEASEQAKMGKTQLARIYEQYDWLYAEKYRRATSPRLVESARGGTQAAEFIRRCKLRGVPREALACVGAVTATRVVGQGSSFLRQQALEFLLGLLGTLPESGRTNLIRDVVASRAGQDKVERYVPSATTPSPEIAEQTAQAMLQVAAMKTGVPPVASPLQNPMVFAGSFLQAGEAALQATQQGGDPHEASSFLALAIPAANAHLQRMSSDKSRAAQLKPMEQRLQQLAHGKEQLDGALQAQQAQADEAHARMQQLQAGQSPETQVGLAKVAAKHQVDLAKADARHQLDASVAAQRLQLDSQRVAGELGLKARKQQVDTALDVAATAHDATLAHVDAAHAGALDRATATHDAALAARDQAHRHALERDAHAHDKRLAEEKAATDAALARQKAARPAANGANGNGGKK